MSNAAPFLVIESDQTKLDALATVARFAGAGNVTACQSTAQAEVALGNGSFGFILCRDQLSPESGCHFIARMRAQDMQSPVVFVSSSPASQNVLEASQTSHTEFLTMPFSLADLQGCLKRLTVGMREA